MSTSANNVSMKSEEGRKGIDLANSPYVEYAKNSEDVQLTVVEGVVWLTSKRDYGKSRIKDLLAYIEEQHKKDERMKCDNHGIRQLVSQI